jgi:hypothetical protein
MAFPVNGVLDNFNRANATPMGGSWSGKIRSADIDASINGNVAHANAAGNASAVWSPAVADDQEAYATVVTADVSDTLEVWCSADERGRRGTERLPHPVHRQRGGLGHPPALPGQRRRVHAARLDVHGHDRERPEDRDRRGRDHDQRVLHDGGVWSTRVTATDAAWSSGSLAIIATANDSLDDFGGGASVAAAVPVLLPTFNPIPLMQVGGP